jgi:hypothetical protein
MIHFEGLNDICQTASTPWPAMTAQVTDSILIDGDIRALCVLPLESLFKVMPTPPHFEVATTANWRGYVASWKIENDRLWLIGLGGRLQNKQQSISEPLLTETNVEGSLFDPREMERLAKDDGRRGCRRPIAERGVLATAKARTQLSISRTNGAWSVEGSSLNFFVSATNRGGNSLAAQA